MGSEAVTETTGMGAKGDAGKANPRAKYRNFIHEPGRNFVFAYVPKVGCTNWKSILRHLAGFEDYLNPRLAHDKKNGGLKYLDLTGEDRALLHDARVPKYAFVRDPYSRVLSAYLNKIASRLPLPESAEDEEYFIRVARVIDRFRRRKLDPAAYPEVNFEVFLLWLRDGLSAFREDEHWQKQTVLLRWPRVKYAWLGHFENLAEEAPVLLEKMGAEVPFPSQKDVKFAPTNAGNKIAAHYTPAAYALVNSLYADDFANFGYEMRDR